MLRRLCFWVLFTIALFVAWRLAGLLLDLVLLVVIVVALILR
ncbi:membrane protein [Klebsiella pneumoniae]|nr:membrane protein [Klebsiella pneumoniae]KYL50808.1 membrane protein [Klebsiella pneumoniae]KYL57945.1 membrane protein [Klebsiella pneumoniae]KYL58123.1 membrane protein [Klebsiella pneumoniae]KYL58165.1 membrane protein [Klebsiella pneumoniae]